IIAAPLACLTFQCFSKPPLRLGAAFQRFTLWLFATIALAPAGIWYWHAWSIAQKFYPHHFFGGGGVRVVGGMAYEHIAVLTATWSLTPVLVMVALAGLVLTRSTIAARPFRWWLAAMAIFIIIAGKGNRHPWYQLPLVPISAAFAGAACAFMAAKIQRRTNAFLSP